MRVRAWLHITAVALLMIGALNWGLIALFDYDAVARAAEMPAWSAEHARFAANVVYALIAAAALLLVVVDGKALWLPFLGQAAYPCGALTPKTPRNADSAVRVRVPTPNANVVFWAAENAQGTSVKGASSVAAAAAATPMTNPLMAYGDYANAGVTRADADGVATLRVRRPAAYSLPAYQMRRINPPHVHYRTCSDGGVLGPVQTTYLAT